jgi:excisionase family DNA binding protein
MKTYSTVQVAKVLGISSDTIHRWIREGMVTAPQTQSLGGVRVRLWTENELEQVRKYKAEHYWGKGSQRKRKSRNKRSR